MMSFALLVAQATGKKPNIWNISKVSAQNK